VRNRKAQPQTGTSTTTTEYSVNEGRVSPFAGVEGDERSLPETGVVDCGERGERWRRVALSADQSGHELALMQDACSGLVAGMKLAQNTRTSCTCFGSILLYLHYKQCIIVIGLP
jgi:hypothetical protein